MKTPTERVMEWRKSMKKAGFKRVEFNLSESTLRRLDALVEKAGTSRAKVLALLIFTAEANQ